MQPLKSVCDGSLAELDELMLKIRLTIAVPHITKRRFSSSSAIPPSMKIQKPDDSKDTTTKRRLPEAERLAASGWGGDNLGPRIRRAKIHFLVLIYKWV